MPRLSYKGQVYGCNHGETVLDALLRQGVDVPFSCRTGVCHVCIHRSTRGVVPTAARRTLDPEQQAGGCFLLCRCRPTGDMEIEPPEGHARPSAAVAPARTVTTAPDQALWLALDGGRRLRTILERFYARVYGDERLMGFFKGVTRQRAVEKQFLFLRQLFTGEKVYFGDRPRNAHHWMVISDELFDYRQALLAACMREEGLGEEAATRWLALEETFRGDIVKSTPVARRMGDVELPLEGFDEALLEVGSVCDGCGGEIAAGTRVRYHKRIGTTYCPGCGARQE